jgi:menaquinone-specific isochorismate synthase
LSTAASLESLTVRTVELAASMVTDLIEVLPPPAPLAWIRHGEGLVGWGEAARLTVSGPDRFARAVAWWQSLGLSPDQHPGLGIPGSGPVVFGSFAFADGPTPSVLVLPRVLLGRRGGRTWLTTIGEPDEVMIAPTPLPRPPADVQIGEGALSADAWAAAVTAAVARIRAGELAKVVLARDLVGRASHPIDVRYLLRDLAHGFPECFTFSVAGLVGATPELLIARDGRRVTSRVLAGTAWRRADEGAGAGAAVAARLTGSDKDREEHDYAARSAAESLRPYCSSLTVPDEPTVLALPNVTHLATEVTGTLRTELPALELAGLLHPTAAVCGTPTAAAARLIAELEGMDRGRYAGPVGWMDVNGDGEWGIALRCAQVDGAGLRLFAGCGIVAGSDPAVELAEAEAKFLAVRRALESQV